MSTPHRNHLRHVRLRSGLSQADVAFLLGLDQSTISHWENRVQNISVQELIAYSVIFDCRPEALIPELVADITHMSKAKARVLLQHKRRTTSSPLFQVRQRVLRALCERKTHPSS